MSLEKALRGIVVGCAFALPFIPLIVSSSMFFPFITGKNFTFRILVEVMAAAWVVLALAYPHYRPRHSWMLYAFSFFVLTIGVSDVLGVNPAKSIWSNFERMEGWITLLHLFLFFGATSSVLTVALWKRLWQTSLAASVLVAGYGLFQFMGLFAINQGTTRLDATLGNSTYLAVYLMFHVFIASLFFIESWVKRSARGGKNMVFVYGAIILFDAFILLFTATRGAILGLLGGTILAALVYAFCNRKTKTARAVFAVAIGLIIFSGIVWLARGTAIVRSIHPLERAATISFTDQTTISRFMNAGMALKGFAERPLFGWGQEHYAVVFDKYYNPSMYPQEPWFDRVHNVIFDWLVAGGILGLAAYLSLYATALYALWRSRAFETWEQSILTGLLAGYLFYLLFTFDNITSYLMFMMVLGYIATRSYGNSPVLLSEKVMPKTYIPAAAVVATLCAVGAIWFANMNAISANRSLILALSSHPEGYGKNLEYFNSALARDTFGTIEIREQLIQAAARISQTPGTTDDLKRSFLDTASKEMMAQAEESPLNARYPLFLGMLYNAFGVSAEAQKALQKAQELSPNKQSILFELGINAISRGNPQEAVAIFEKAYDLERSNPQARIFLAVGYIQAGQVEKADPLLPLIAADGYATDNRILASYAGLKRYDKIAEVSGLQIEREPEVPQAYFTRAAALYLSNNREGAVQTLEAVKAAIPETKTQADSLIEQIRSGTLKVQ